MNSPGSDNQQRPFRRKFCADASWWVLSLFFVGVGVVLTASAAKVMLKDLDWKDANTTTGRVVLTEWQHEKQDNRLRITYRYKDSHNTIYHNTGVVARKQGQVNLKPGSPIVVLYKKDDHGNSCLNMELNSGQCWPLLVIGIVEILAGMLFLVSCFRRRGSKRLVSPA
jgi:hypothetical protein